METVKTKLQKYEDSIALLKKVFQKHNTTNKLSYISKLTLISSVLHQNFDYFHFVGFYLVTPLLDENSQPTSQEVLEIGPFQSPIVPTPRISFGKGVCGTCWQEKKTIIENDVSVCKNYIACDGSTQAEIVVPLWDGQKKKVLAVLDIDGQEKNLFDETDIKFLEEILEYVHV